MAAKWTADWVNRLFILKAGVTDLDIQVDLYSDWKEEVQLSDNIKYPPALRTVGGDPLGGGDSLGGTYFLINGWQIRPQEADHTLTMTGNLFTDPSGTEIIVPTLGDYTVLIQNKVSNLTEVKASDASLSADQIFALVGAVYIDTVNGVSGTDGTQGQPTNPVNNLTDAYTIAQRENLTTYKFKGALTLDRNYSDWAFLGLGSEADNDIIFNGQTVNRALFQNCTVTGTMVGSVELFECSLIAVVGFDGVARWCGLQNTTQLANSAKAVFDNCFSEVAGTNTPAFDLGTNCNLNCRHYSGGIKVENSTSGCTGTIDLDSGHVVLDSTDIGGTLVIRGVGHLTDNGSTGMTLVTDGLVQGKDVSQTRKILANQMRTDPDTGVLTIYDDDDTTVLFTASLYEDVAGVQTYRGQGAERRNKLS